MPKLFAQACASGCLTLLGTSAMAHPGIHGDITVDHMASSAFHLGTIAVFTAAAIIVLAILDHRQTRSEKARKDH